MGWKGPYCIAGSLPLEKSVPALSPAFRNKTTHMQATSTITDGGGGTTGGGGGASAACKIQYVSGGGQHSAIIVETGSTGFAL